MTTKPLKFKEYEFSTLVPVSVYGKTDGVLHSKYAPDDRVTFVKEMICRWGLVVAEGDGEDSAGRAKLRRMTPEEVVSTACDIAELAFAEFKKRGWMERLPDIEEMRKMGLENATSHSDDD